uniref:Uncharacterized protein n=1 Tax=Rhizophora mucronata TaxID=61149 RepID=A0A2P2JM26_RHIMU
MWHAQVSTWEQSGISHTERDKCRGEKGETGGTSSKLRFETANQGSPEERI